MPVTGAYRLEEIILSPHWDAVLLLDALITKGTIEMSCVFPTIKLSTRLNVLLI
jgi:hypothetical protein